MREKRIGFFGGTFDPIHLGHLHLAHELMKRHALNEVIFCPALVSPHKQGALAPFADRLAMIQLAIQPYPNFGVTDIEGRRPSPSYTIDTLRSLKEERPGAQFFLLLAEDQLAQLHTWREVEELLKLAPPLVGRRSGGAHGVGVAEALRGAVEAGMTEMEPREVSSTEVRARLQRSEGCEELVPKAVLEYIRARRLYV